MSTKMKLTCCVFCTKDTVPYRKSTKKFIYIIYCLQLTISTISPFIVSKTPTRCFFTTPSRCFFNWIFKWNQRKWHCFSRPKMKFWILCQFGVNTFTFEKNLKCSTGHAKWGFDNAAENVFCGKSENCSLKVGNCIKIRIFSEKKAFFLNMFFWTCRIDRVSRKKKTPW